MEAQVDKKKNNRKTDLVLLTFIVLLAGLLVIGIRFIWV